MSESHKKSEKKFHSFNLNFAYYHQTVSCDIAQIGWSGSCVSHTVQKYTRRAYSIYPDDDGLAKIPNGS